jgi:hypothetical protein
MNALLLDRSLPASGAGGLKSQYRNLLVERRIKHRRGARAHAKFLHRS